MSTMKDAFSEDTARSLADKLAQFDASLSQEERNLFRSRVLAAIDADYDVEGHRLEMRWTAGPEGLFRTWVEIDESSTDSRTSVDPSRWTTMSSQAEPSRSQGLELQSSENSG